MPPKGWKKSAQKPKEEPKVVHTENNTGPVLPELGPDQRFFEAPDGTLKPGPIDVNSIPYRMLDGSFIRIRPSRSFKTR